jgi:multidrug efflux pump subunit AcrA (membrane-fusion protein)
MFNGLAINFIINFIINSAIILLLLSFSSVANDDIILSGQIKARDNQAFYAPKTDSWRVQVQWLLPEGDIAKKGDLVVVFDSGSIQSQIEQQEVSLIVAKEELHRITSSNKQTLLEADFGQKKAALILEKSRIDASITVEYLSQYDYEKNQLQFEKALVENAKEKENLKQTKVKNLVALTKQKLTINKLEEQLGYNRHKLKQMSVYAERSGPVLYGNHPWNGEKVFVGMTAQPSWKIAEITSVNGLYVESWVHEIDYKNLSLNSRTKITLDAFPDARLTGKLTKISTQPEERKEWGKGVYYRSVFEFDVASTQTLVPGMSVQLEFEGSNNE